MTYYKVIEVEKNKNYYKKIKIYISNLRTFAYSSCHYNTHRWKVKQIGKNLVDMNKKSQRICNLSFFWKAVWANTAFLFSIAPCWLILTFLTLFLLGGVHGEEADIYLTFEHFWKTFENLIVCLQNKLKKLKKNLC
jgi:hypothetical protein